MWFIPTMILFNPTRERQQGSSLFSESIQVCLLISEIKIDNKRRRGLLVDVPGVQCTWTHSRSCRSRMENGRHHGYDDSLKERGECSSRFQHLIYQRSDKDFTLTWPGSELVSRCACVTPWVTLRRSEDLITRMLKRVVHRRSY